MWKITGNNLKKIAAYESATYNQQLVNKNSLFEARFMKSIRNLQLVTRNTQLAMNTTVLNPKP